MGRTRGRHWPQSARWPTESLPEALRLERGVIAAIGRSLPAETGRSRRALQELLRYARLHVARSELLSGNRPRADSLLAAIRGDSGATWRNRERRLFDSLTQVLTRD